VLADPAYKLPAVYRAVVEAGLRAGRLPAALEALAGSMRRLAQTRRSVLSALLYPWLLLVVAWVLFALMTAWIAPALLASFQALGVRGTEALRPLAWCGRHAALWGPAGPVLLLLLAAAWYYGSSRAALAGSRRAGCLLGWLPWLGRTLRWSRMATFLEILTLLVEQQMPLDEALTLAGQASGDADLAAEAQARARAVRRGESAGEGLSQVSRGLSQVSSDETGTVPLGPLAPPGVLPPLVDWLLGGPSRQDMLLPALRNVADDYHRRAQHQVDLARVLLPVLITLGVGGTVALLFALTVFLPYVTMLKSLAGM
jgi:general secretion pathway protein F